MLKLQDLKAAMVLVCDKHVRWVHVPVLFGGKKYIIAQAPSAALTQLASKLLKDNGIEHITVQDSSGTCTLLPFDAMQVIDEPEERKPLVLDDAAEGPKNQILQILYDGGITRLDVTYSGSGDNSNDDEFSYGIAPIPFYPNYGNEVSKVWAAALESMPLGEDVHIMISEWIWNDLTSSYDCHNNEGGGGTLNFDLSDPGAPVVHFTLYTNETVQTEHEDQDL